MNFCLRVLFLILFSATLGMAQNAKSAVLSIYPNPATEFISVSENGSSEPLEQVAIYNLVGKKVREFEYVRGEQYSVADLPKGIYLVQLLDRNKRVVRTQKIDKR